MKYFFAFILFLASTSFVQNVDAWGGRGHDGICQAAVYLVGNPDLKEFLQNKPNMMGHLCNIPDTYWRSLSPEITTEGGPTHYVDPEMIGLKLNEIPTDFRGLVRTYQGGPNQTKKDSKILSFAHEFGSNWWRTDQLYRFSVEAGKKLQGLSGPANPKEEQDDKNMFNVHLYAMLTNMGLMGHFVGDNAQPLHVTIDYDGYAAGHGGIHAYYEDQAVAFLPAGLDKKIVDRAKIINERKEMKNLLAQKTVTEKMRALAVLSRRDLKKVFERDPVTKPSSIENSKGLTINIPATRQPGSAGAKVYEKMIVEQMARAALLLARLWDDIYVAVGSPPLKAYKSYRYPLTPDFVMPDYYEIKTPVPNNPSAK